MNKRLVISGAPGTGKSSIIKSLEDKGYAVMHEVSREIIREQMELKTDVLPWKNLYSFSKLVIEKRIEQFKTEQHVSFYDRSIIDALAYLNYDGLKIQEEWHIAGDQNRYHREVLITPPWKEIYTKDNERKESFEEAVVLHEIIKETYVNYGYLVLEIPLGSVESRVKFILNHLNLDD